MNQPLGNYSGIACEVQESIDALNGNGDSDLMDVVYHLAESIILLNDEKSDKVKLKELINSGKAFNKFKKMVEAHGGSLDKFHKKNYQSVESRYVVRADNDGFLKSYSTKTIGELLSSIGSGTLGNKDGIDNWSGLRVYKKIADEVKQGDPILEFYCSSQEKINNLTTKANKIFEISNRATKKQKLIYQ